jgi:Fe-S cluster assembly iron-binding protein IscA
MPGAMRNHRAHLLLVALSYCTTTVHGHSWIDCFDTDRSKIYDQSASYIYGGTGGNGFCEGYGAGYPGRGDTDIGTDYTYKMLLNEVEAGVAVCQSVGDDTYTDWRTRVSVAAGTQIYYAYLPNGHIVKDKKGIGTQHGIYWTGVAGTALSTTADMTAANLIDGFTLDFDDGNCGETYDYNGNPGGRAGDGKPCVGYFTIPAGTAAGIYKMVWYWSFYLEDGSYADASLAKGYFGASYSTCFEVEVTSGSGSAAATTAPVATTAAPVATTAAPVATTAAPVAATAAPTETTAAPAATTAAPAETTAAPAATTAAPAATSDASASAATTPETTTATPTATVATESRSLDFSTLANSTSSAVGSVHAASSSSDSISVDDVVVGTDDSSTTTTTTTSASASDSASSSDNVNVEVESNSATRLNGGVPWMAAVSSAAITSALFHLVV